MAEEQIKKSKGKRLTGIVASNKMQKTLVIEVRRLVAHPIYKKRRRVSKRYKAHYDSGEYNIGDKVQIEETRPLSRGKRWRVIAR